MEFIIFSTLINHMYNADTVRKLKIIHNDVFEFAREFNNDLYTFKNGDENDVRIQNVIYNNVPLEPILRLFIRTLG